MKKVVSGNGHANKDFVRACVQRQTGIVVKSDDEADAIGILLAHQRKGKA